MHIYFVTYNYDKLCENDVPGKKERVSLVFYQIQCNKML